MTPIAEPPRPRTGVRRVLGNLAHLLGGKAAAGLISLVYLVIVTHALGARGYGVLVLVNAYVVMVGGIVAFSGFHGVVRYGVIALEAGDRDSFFRIVRLMTLIELSFGLAAIVIAAALAPLIGQHLGWSHETTRFAVLYSFAVVATVRATPQGLLQIAGRFDLIGLHQTVSPLVRLVGTIAVWAAGGGVAGFLSVWLVAAVAEGLAMWLFGLREWRRLSANEGFLGPWRGVIRNTEGFGRFILTTNFDITLRELAPNLAPLTVGWLLGPATTGLLALAQRATSLLQQPGLLLSQASYPVLAGLVAKREMGSFRRTVWRSAGLAAAAAAPIVLLLSLFGGRLLVLIGGGSFVGAKTLLVLVALSRACALAGAPITSGLIALGRPQRSLAVALVANLGLYPILPLLLWGFGVNGAGWHALSQNLVATGALAFFFAYDTGKLRRQARLDETSNDGP